MLRRFPPSEPLEADGLAGEPTQCSVFMNKGFNQSFLTVRYKENKKSFQFSFNDVSFHSWKLLIYLPFKVHIFDVYMFQFLFLNKDVV